MTSPLASLQPALLWSHFDRLRQIPRGSGDEAAVRAHLVAWAKERGFEPVLDRVGNLVVRVPASKGHEHARTVILQGHLDMVAEKNKSSSHDFTKDPIQVRVDGGWVIADETTLGADNGIGVAAALASADDPSCVHGPLELLFTIDEENGLTGANGLDGSLLRGRTLLNLDSEEDGTLFVGCAGGTTTEIDLDLHRTPATPGTVALEVSVAGLRGGHSGLNIHENRGNAIRILARILSAWLPMEPVRIDSIEGGNKSNAIPREATAIVTVSAALAERAAMLAAEHVKKIATEYQTIDPGLKVTVRPAPTPATPADAESSKRLLQVLVALPHGVLAMSRDIPGLTETSTNLAIVHGTATGVHVTTSTRSSVAVALRAGLDQANAVLALAGARVEETGAYPSWQPNMASPLLETCKAVHRGLHGGLPKVTAIHAGLECGIIADQIGEAVDIISYGPEIAGAHAPGEKVDIASTARFWEFHKALLAALA
ncbi:aminoacyl-histidine dipeptidase [Myxococcota bacterium]|nr:aminoacyl-histidine dipeptidase [Myxococcota bacterium]